MKMTGFALKTESRRAISVFAIWGKLSLFRSVSGEAFLFPAGVRTESNEFWLGIIVIVQTTSLYALYLVCEGLVLQAAA